MATRLVSGNSAVCIGALYAGCDCFFGYPITPANEILHEVARCFPPVGRKYVQAESEGAAVGMAYGGAAAGHRVMTASSGPGISLKQEGISFLAATELPCVIIDIMRAGPGLGNIGPEQGDYNQMVKGGGHGNYRNIVLAPDSVQEMCDCTIKAFDLADTYRNPVVVLADGVLGQMIEPLRFPEESRHPTVDTSWAVNGTAATRGNLLTSIFLDFDELEARNYLLQEKYALIESKEADWESYLVDDAETVLVAYGITSRVCRSAVDRCRDAGIPVGLFRPKTLYPFPKETLKAIADSRDCRFVSVEMSNGQMIDDIRLAIGCSRPVLLVNRLGGSLIAVDQVIQAVTGEDGSEGRQR